ncbi:lipoyl(octanoyl) transferase LipB [Kistimonas asteriae]|uniref:lipoyl(octanoyl) transferase LipB n=1 Tax=Kistimonas asteriae TaxID=517724 RepID=UPI001BAA2505|nr:lipoyl(octanoyl) transferase LipB [Kistimonas asteriae]
MTEPFPRHEPINEPERLIIRQLGIQPYEPVWKAMAAYTDGRDRQCSDEIWLLEHQPVFTQGQAGKAEHVLNPGDIPIVQVDRGGQVTYHGPGQLVAYLLLDIRRLGLGARALVTHIENAIVATLKEYGVAAAAKPDAPGVYVDNAKIASLGLRIRRGCSFHGLALNINGDLSPFLRINPCGYAGLAMTRLADYDNSADCTSAAERLTHHLVQGLGYTEIETRQSWD